MSYSCVPLENEADDRLAENILAQAEEGERGIVAKNGVAVTGFTKHGVDRAIGDLFKRLGVAARHILDALKNPERIGPVVYRADGRPSQRFIGRNAEVVVNPQTGKIISVNPASSRGDR